MDEETNLNQYHNLEWQIRELGTITIENASRQRHHFSPNVLLKFDTARRSILRHLAELREELTGCDRFLEQYRKLNWSDRFVLLKTAIQVSIRSRDLVTKIEESSCVEKTHAPMLRERARLGLLVLYGSQE